VECFVAVVAAAMVIFALPVVHVFNRDLAMVGTAVQFIHIAAIGWALMGFQFVLMNCLQGAGDTIPTMLIGIFTTWVITIPLAYFLPLHTGWGALGIRWAMTTSVVVGAIANVLYFRSGKWKTRHV
jgi:MATE family multidrug resistance protein